MRKGVKLKHPFDKMKVGDTMVGKAHVVQCAINWAKRQNNGWIFSSKRNTNYKETKSITLKRIK